ncbi:hypothetical protein BW12_02955 [Bifidobacterium sp. UTCIF-3]|nr:hypothetical protein BW09_03715 [Bifidobacterium sp. UTCIF-1]TPF80868.1 hypothetical protein BW08_02680 [Bifidobacterium sp. UTCIF-24]TPF82693.1 hypothetical protein BW12_02955 [Bifidobacterium sp. UTCIF-3]TPF84533.1 hypothetical protein BW07_04605 [Bifidobacterium sp. UTCIF-36]TPF90906.1 hypothetical protein BW10_01430 [Bifidobacterium sp. UTBIF-56]
MQYARKTLHLIQRFMNLISHHLMRMAFHWQIHLHLLRVLCLQMMIIPEKQLSLLLQPLW